MRLRAEGHTLVAEVTDDGRGFDPTVAQGGVGLVGMRERVEELGGEIEVGSRPGEGAKVTIRVAMGRGTSTPMTSIRDAFPPRRVCPTWGKVASQRSEARLLWRAATAGSTAPAR